MTSTQISQNESSTDGMVRADTAWGQDAENTPVYTVTAAVADAIDADQLELPPLYEAIDPDALNSLLTSGGAPSECQVSFQYAGCAVTVQGTGEVRVRPDQDA
ncbi:HalOD1 output domain-containing protein [Natronorubrum halalkaliphilum]|nr:HalOD1 output domain-containing protein [Natronorubrum halalkaliphilum]